MPYTTVRTPESVPRLPYQFSHEIDLRSERTLGDLAGLRLDPSARLNAPYIPSTVPFSPSTSGKHIVMTDGRRILTIPRANPVNAFTMGGIVRDSGLTLEDFRKLL